MSRYPEDVTWTSRRGGHCVMVRTLSTEAFHRSDCFDCDWRGVFFDRVDAERHAAGHTAQSPEDG
jgi:hypothetical protein